MAETGRSDMGVGLGAAFALLGLVGAAAMYVAGSSHDRVLAGWGFALAMLAASLAIAAIHVYGFTRT